MKNGTSANKANKSDESSELKGLFFFFAEGVNWQCPKDTNSINNL